MDCNTSIKNGSRDRVNLLGLWSLRSVPMPVSVRFRQCQTVMERTMGNPFTRIASWGPERDLTQAVSAGLSTPLIRKHDYGAFWEGHNCVFGLTSMFWLCFLYGQAIVFSRWALGSWNPRPVTLWCKPSLAVTKTKEKVRRGRARSHEKRKGIEFAYVLGRSCTILAPSFLYYYFFNWCCSVLFLFLWRQVLLLGPSPHQKRIEGVIFRVLVYASKPSVSFWFGHNYFLSDFSSDIQAAVASRSFLRLPQKGTRRRP